VIALHPGQIGALGGKLADVGAGREIAALAAHDHAAHGIVLRDAGKDLAQVAPHADRDRVQASRMRQRHPGQMPFALKPHTVLALALAMASHVLRHVPCPRCCC